MSTAQSTSNIFQTQDNQTINNILETTQDESQNSQTQPTPVTLEDFHERMKQTLNVFTYKEKPIGISQDIYFEKKKKKK